jgi:hypothetical protein
MLVLRYDTTIGAFESGMTSAARALNKILASVSIAICVRYLHWVIAQREQLLPLQPADYIGLSCPVCVAGNLSFFVEDCGVMKLLNLVLQVIDKYFTPGDFDSNIVRVVHTASFIGTRN